MKEQKYLALTGIRAVAAAMVFLFHNAHHWEKKIPSILRGIVNEFHVGVSIFFVLSGFLIAYTYEDKPVTTSRSYIQYYLIRLSRVLPAYFFILSIHYLYYGFSSFEKVFYNYSLLKGFSGVFILDGVGQSWSLTVELLFYLVAPFMYWLTCKKQGNLKLLLFMLFLLVLAIAIGQVWHQLNGNKNQWLFDWFFVLTATFFGRFFEFYVGIILAVYLKKTRQNKQYSTRFEKSSIGTYLLLLATLIVIMCISFFATNVYIHGVDTLLGLLIRNIVLPIVVAVLLYYLMFQVTLVSKLLSTKLMVLLGNASFFFYLIHVGAISSMLNKRVMLPDRNFTLLWLVSILGYWFIEKPLYSFLRTFITNKFVLKS